MELRSEDKKYGKIIIFIILLVFIIGSFSYSGIYTYKVLTYDKVVGTITDVYTKNIGTGGQDNRVSYITYQYHYQSNLHTNNKMIDKLYSEENIGESLDVYVKSNSPENVMTTYGSTAGYGYCIFSVFLMILYIENIDKFIWHV